MIFIKHEEGRVTYANYFPFDPIHGLGKGRELLEKEGVFVDYFPEAENRIGEIPITMFDESTKTIYYVYEKTPMDPAQQVEILKKEDLTNKEAIAELYMMVMMLPGGDI